MNRTTMHCAARCAILQGVGGLLVLLATTATATTLITITNTSPSFSLGYGRQITFGNTPWTTSESTGVNTPPGSPQAGASVDGNWTFGNFKFSNIVNSTIFSGAGPQFPNRVLSDGPNAVSGESITWTNTISVTWTDGTPGVVPEIPTNARVRLNITQLSVYAVACCGLTGANTNLMFSEITLGHETNSPSLTLNAVDFGGLNTASNYKQLVWDPVDFTVSGTNLTRTFVLTGDADFAVDGFEIIGNAQFIYDVPEPASGILFASAICLLWRRRR